MNYLFASTNFGTEKLLEKELLHLGAKNINIIKGGVYYEANELSMYQSLMWSRIASRIFLCIKTFNIKSKNDLYRNIYDINWSNIFNINNTFIINFQGTNSIFRNSLFGSLTIKDAIVDQFNHKYSLRPNVDIINPDIRIKSFLSQNTVRIMLDLSGDSLNKRGYRVHYNTTPIKENLAAAIILSSQWNKKKSMIDPMCGSGTLLIEAAMICSDRAPGLKRLKWGFKSWKKYNNILWNSICEDALNRFHIGVKSCFKHQFIGYDCNSETIKKAKKNAFNADLINVITFIICDLNNFKNTYHEKKVGIILSNPPYGERYKTENQLVALYVQLGVTLKHNFSNWNASIFSMSKYLLSFLQMQSHEEFYYKNGSIDCIQKNYKVFSKKIEYDNHEYKNRLEKNVKKLKKWSNLEKIECFRIYNADIPNYNIIVDIYKEWVVIQEYQAPKIINYHKSHKRLCDAIYLTKEVLCVSINRIILKIRKKNKNHTQYQKLFNSNNFFIVQEYYSKFLVNVIDYLDTGLFSEKRLLRKLLGKMSRNKDFLNLFAYTGTASVYAGLGQAKSTTTVDISNTYIKWSMRNMSINNLKGSEHSFIQADCLDWITKTNKKFDLIFVNPPTFSNSKRMKKTFELKRDYIHFIYHLKKLLHNNGSIIFSSSTKNFKINFIDLNKIKLHATQITQKIQTKDHYHHSNIYHSWLIKNI